jgi:hypothetical protein
VVGLTWPEVLARLSRRGSLSTGQAEETLTIVLVGEDDSQNAMTQGSEQILRR